jgi:hypothetical protein
MRMRRIIGWLGIASIAVATIGCSDDTSVSTAKQGPAPPPPSNLKAKFEKPATPPVSGKPGG